LLVSLAVKRLKAIWQSLWVDVDRRVRLGRILGLVFVTAGFVLMGLAWNGAASQNLIQAQFPYLLSGGLMGLALVILGASLWMLSTVRGERQVMSDKVDEMIQLLGRTLARSGAGASSAPANGVEVPDVQVIATKDAYHLAGCRILEGKTGLTPITVAQAAAEGLAACRVCEPPIPPPEEEVSEPPTAEATPDAGDGSSDEEDAAQASSDGQDSGDASKEKAATGASEKPAP
jgi:hypothetical protein